MPDLVGHGADGGGRQLNPIQVLERGLNIACRHTLGVEADDLVFQLIGAGLIRLQQW